MTSQRRIAANRRNSQKSCGPRGAAGKAIASRNALRHGLAAIVQIRPGLSPELERFAKALCGDDNDPLLFDEALIIAGNDLVLRSICAQRVAVIERLRDKSSVALAKGDNSIALVKALQRKFGPAFDAQYAALDERLSKPQTKPKEYLEWPIDIDAATKMFKERDECEAMEEAAADLTRLERYHRRTWSRQKRAIRNFTNMKLMRALAETAEPAPNKRELTPK